MNKTCLLNGEEIVRAYDFIEEGKSDSDVIEAAISYQKEKGIRTLLLSEKNWNLDRSILFFSHSEIIVDAVRIKLNDSVFDNIFRPENIVIDPDEPYGFPLKMAKTEDFRIIGKNGARLEGATVKKMLYNPVTESDAPAVSDVWGWRTFIIWLPLCDHFEISGFSFGYSSAWTVSLEHSHHGYLHHFDIFTDVYNGDGINIRLGCSFIKIEYIYGNTSDDCVAINSEGKCVEHPYKKYIYPLRPTVALIREGEPIEETYVHDITVRNIYSTTNDYSQAVTVNAGDRHKIYNVEIQNIFDTSPVKLSKRCDVVGVYYTEAYCPEYQIGDIENLTIDNVVSTSAHDAVLFRMHVTGVTVSNIYQICPGGNVLTCFPDDEIILTGNNIINGGQLRADVANFKLITSLS